MNELETKIANIPAGKTFGVIGHQRTYIVRKTSDGRYQIEAAWEVPESYDDDPESYTYHPFKSASGKPRFGVCWVGRRVTTNDISVAAATYEKFKAALLSYAVPTEGEIIGSVSR